MFYSHQLLARKAPMGQIWMAATLHAKMSKTKLSKIDLIQICDEILNPKVPMALRLSSILMGGVVIVYERKVQFLYDDVNRLLVKLNEAWKVKKVDDRNILPKGKRQAKPEAITLPNQNYSDIGDVEQFMDFSPSKSFPAMNFNASAYFTMNLDAFDELGGDIREEDLTHQHHQASLADITMEDAFDPYQTETVAYTSFERFDLEGDEEIQMPFLSQDHAEVHHSPPPAASSFPREETNQGFEMDGMQPEAELNQPQDEAIDNRQKPVGEPEKTNVPKKRGKRRSSKNIIDDYNVLIPSTEYQSWLQNTSDIVSGGRKKKKHGDHESSLKMKCPWDMPNMALLPDLLGNGISDHYFPAQLKELWTKCLKSNLNSPPTRMNSARNARTKSSSPPSLQGSKEDFQDPQNMFDGGFTSGSNASVEVQRAVPALERNFMPPEFIIGAGSAHNITPNRNVNDLTALLSQASLGSVHKPFTNNSEGNTRSSKRRHHSSSQNNNSGLRTVVENPDDAEMEREPNFIINEVVEEPSFKLAKSLTPEKAFTNTSPLLEETIRTQTQHPVPDQEIENTTTIIRTHLKTYFEGPEAPQTESMNQLAEGMKRKQVAQLFFQTCVLASRECLKVKQMEAYGDILISRGPKM